MIISWPNLDLPNRMRVLSLPTHLHTSVEFRALKPVSNLEKTSEWPCTEDRLRYPALKNLLGIGFFCLFVRLFLVLFFFVFSRFRYVIRPHVANCFLMSSREGTVSAHIIIQRNQPGNAIQLHHNNQLLQSHDVITWEWH